MTIGEQTKAWYDEHERGGFAPALLRCFLFGVVVKRPEFVLLAEGVLTDGKNILAVAPYCVPNCWWLYFIGAPTGQTTPYDWMNEAPYPLEYVAFKRKGKLKIYTWARIRKDVYGRIPSSTSACNA